MEGGTSIVTYINNNGNGIEMREHYETEYARFFNYPPPTTNPNNTNPDTVAKSNGWKTSNVNSGGDDDGVDGPTSRRLRPLSKSRKRLHRGGTWLSTSAAASLHLYYTTVAADDHSLPHLVLVIYLHGKIFEQHFVSKLHFSWPQLSSCDSQRPVKGSRVVFASFKDCIGQIQKFAMRFPNSSESETFINTLKERLGASSENLCHVSAKRVHHRADEELINAYSVANYPPLIESLDDGVTNFEKSTLQHEFEDTYAPLPSTFTTLLVDDCTEAQQEPPSGHEEVDLNTQIAKYMTASSFNDMLIKLENAIIDMGGGLAL